jgi:hypothetical protein
MAAADCHAGQSLVEYGQGSFKARAFSRETGPRDAAESILHAGLERPLHLATTLLSKQQVGCFVRRSGV